MTAPAATRALATPFAAGEAAGSHRSAVGVGRAASAPPTAGDAVRRYVTQGRYGTITVDVVGDAVYVNGAPVEPAAPSRG